MLGSVLSDLLRGWRKKPRAKHAPGMARVPIPPTSSMRTMPPGWQIFGDDSGMQSPFDVAVVMPTILRPTVIQAVESVFAQSPRLRIQLLLGVDAPLGPPEALPRLLQRSPNHVTSCLFYPGYSTSVRHGGVHTARDGGSLRAILTYLANSRLVAYLDDDNWWEGDHLKAMVEAMPGHDWVYSMRWFVHPVTREPIAQDIWESVGPGRGVYEQRFGGWVDPNCLMLDKIACEGAIRWWCTPLWGDEKAMSGDRRVYDYLQRHGEPGCTNLATVYYVLDSQDVMHSKRVEVMGEAYARAESRVRAAA